MNGIGVDPGPATRGRAGRTVLSPWGEVPVTDYLALTSPRWQRRSRAAGFPTLGDALDWARRAAESSAQPDPIRHLAERLQVPYRVLAAVREVRDAYRVDR